MAFADKILACRDCGTEFTFTAGEQEFYLARGLQSEPSRCQECRASKRQSRSSDYGAPRQMHPAVCASCGIETEVPFEPRSGRPVYCRECFAKMRSRG